MRSRGSGRPSPRPRSQYAGAPTRAAGATSSSLIHRQRPRIIPDHLIADTAHRANRRTAERRINLTPEHRHVDLDQVVRPVVIDVPDLVEDLLLVNDLTR